MIYKEFTPPEINLLLKGLSTYYVTQDSTDILSVLHKNNLDIVKSSVTPGDLSINILDLIMNQSNAQLYFKLWPMLALSLKEKCSPAKLLELINKYSNIIINKLETKDRSVLNILQYIIGDFYKITAHPQLSTGPECWAKSYITSLCEQKQVRDIISDNDFLIYMLRSYNFHFLICRYYAPVSYLTYYKFVPFEVTSNSIYQSLISYEAYNASLGYLITSAQLQEIAISLKGLHQGDLEQIDILENKWGIPVTKILNGCTTTSGFLSNMSAYFKNIKVVEKL